jgi:predicted Rossmann fold nucleotide-binding protein DprA/Smf involved in DNA uptake
MALNVSIVESTNPDFPASLRKGGLIPRLPRLSAIGNLEILKTRLIGFFCSARCPGNIIVQTYDLARALRDAGIAVISGFHASMEKECLEILLRGTQPVVICPARSIERMRLPASWRTSVADNRLLVLSPIAAKYRRPTASLAGQRNRFVATLADAVLIPYANPGSKIDQLYVQMMASGKRVYTLDLPDNAGLMQQGATGFAVPDLVDCLLGQ